MNLLWPMDPHKMTCISNLADKHTLADGSPQTSKMTCTDG